MKAIGIHYLLAAALLLGAVSCQRSENPAGTPDGDLSTVRLSLGFPGTRADALVAATAGEKAVNRIDVLVFDHADGSLQESLSEAAADLDDVMHVDMRVPKRRLDFRVVANAPAGSLDGVLSMATLDAAASLFTDNAADSFVMCGSVDNVDPEATPNVAVTLERIACKVVLKKVTKAFASAVVQDKTVRLKDVRLVNVRKSVSVFGSPDPAPRAEDASYINPRSFTETGTCMVGAAGLDYEVTAAGTAVGDGITLYFYPNAAAEAPTAEDEDYVTKLVMTCDIGGTIYRYPIGIVQEAGAKGRNLVYNVENVLLTLIGNDEDDSPNKYITKKSALVSLNVLDWDTYEVDPAWVNVRPVFSVDGFSAPSAASGSMTLTVVSQTSDMIGRSSALGWMAQVSTDGGVTWSSSFPSWLTLSPSSGQGSLTGGESVTLSWNKTAAGTSVSWDKVLVRFVQDTTGRILLRRMN